MSKKYIIFSSIAVIFIIIAIPTIYKIIKNYNSKAYLVVEKKIVEAAKKCYQEDKCLEDEITLKDLYDNEYLDTMVNPVTKKKYPEDLKIKRSENGYKVNVR